MTKKNEKKDSARRSFQKSNLHPSKLSPVRKARTGFRLLKCLASMGMWLCTHKVKGAFPSMHSDRAQWTFHWFGGLVNSNIP